MRFYEVINIILTSLYFKKRKDQYSVFYLD